MLNSFPLISVIIPTYNRAKLIPKAIESVRNQIYPNIELLIIDDGSTDNTQSVVQDISKTYPSLIYLKKENGGCASARNLGIQNATGELLAFLDSDDEWYPDAISNMVEVINKSQADLVYSPATEIFPNGQEIFNPPVAENQPEKLARLHFLNTNVRNGSYIFTRLLQTKVGLLRENLRYNEDSDYFQRLSINGKAAYLEKATVRVFNHQEGKSHNRPELYKALLASSEDILKQYPEFSRLLGKPAQARITQIKKLILESYIVAGKWDELNRISDDMKKGITSIERLSIILRSNIPVLFSQKTQKILRIVKKRFSG